MVLTRTWLEILSEWLVNLSAAWIGAVVVLPAVIPLQSASDVVLLFPNIGFGILALYLAKRLRELKEKK